MVEEGDDERVTVSEAGAIEPLGATAALRLQARRGVFRALPSPEDLLVLQRVASPEAPPRRCLMLGEASAPGVLCDVLSFIAQAGWRVEVVVHAATTARSLFLDQGSILGGQSSEPHERLGEVLFRYGALTREQVERAGEATTEGVRRFGEAAVKLGFLTREALFSLMARQTEEIVFGTLLVEDATYFVLDGFDDARLASRQILPLPPLIRDAIRRMHETKYFRARIPSERHVPAFTASDHAPLSDPLGLLAVVDGARCIAAICRMLGAGEFEVTRALFQLVQAGRVVILPPRLSVAEVVSLASEAVALVLRELDARDEGDPVREQLAAFVASRPQAPLLSPAGPRDDGTFDEAIVAEMVARARLGDVEVDALSRALHEYVSYALFLARPLLARGEDSAPGKKGRLSTRVSALLEPLSSRLDPSKESR